MLSRIVRQKYKIEYFVNCDYFESNFTNALRSKKKKNKIKKLLKLKNELENLTVEKAIINSLPFEDGFEDIISIDIERAYAGEYIYTKERTYRIKAVYHSTSGYCYLIDERDYPEENAAEKQLKFQRIKDEYIKKIEHEICNMNK